MTRIQLLSVVGLFSFLASPAWAVEPTRIPPRSGLPEKTNVDVLKQKYWAQGEESELEVVQNRTYSKAHKIGISVFTGTLATDPFLSVKNIGLRAGYYINEFFGIFGVYWKSSSNKSSALVAFESYSGSTTNNNPPKGFKGLQAEVSPIYGKLSLFGKAIVYYDLTASLGAGITSTDNGNYITPYFGIGQKIYLAKQWALSVDYRLMVYNEDIIAKVAPTKPGDPALGAFILARKNWTDVITVGVEFNFGLYY